jgi:2-polyprenyl-6-hydroxyphenyl methylase/3-demethylubiquinone-9 3-methyltransferase
VNRGGEYYADSLSAGRLKRVYDLATPRVLQYLKAEIDHVLEHLKSDDTVLELGCGYGRVLPELAETARFVVGIDLAVDSLRFGPKLLRDVPNVCLAAMDAVRLGFEDETFDVVACIQNGISAFHVDQRELIEEALRVTRPGGIALFSSYSEKFWEPRLEWFRLQAKEGLLGELDEEKTGNGCIVCKDGFTATTVSPDEFLELSANLDAYVNIVEVDGSSVFCELSRNP